MFDSRLLNAQPGDVVFQDRYKEVEVALAFRKAECYRCGFVGFYKFQVQQLRRNPEVACLESEELRQDHLEIWRAIPRFAEIPETVKCKRCGEVMGFGTNCVF